MNFLFFAFALMMPPIAGFLLASLCWPNQENKRALWGCKFWLSIGIGLGIAAFTEFFTLVIAGCANILITLLLEGGLILVFGSMLWRRKIALPPSCKHDQTTSQSALTRMLVWGFYVSFFLAVGIFMLYSLENPHGEPDAWTFWNSRARLFFRAGPQWFQFFSQGCWSFPTYPLQTSMNVLRLWSAFGREITAGPIVIAGLFTFASIGLIASTLTHLRGYSQGAIGGLLLASTPYFLKHGAAQYADVPLGFYILATVILCNGPDPAHKKISGTMCLAGLTAGLAAWTKEEGLLFIASVIMARLLTMLIFRGKDRQGDREVRSFFIGLVPIILFIGYFRSFIAPSNPFPSPTHGLSQMITQLTDCFRYLQTGKAFVRQVIEPYSLVYSTPIAILGLYAIFLGFRAAAFEKPGVVTAFLTVCGMFCGYFGMYLITPVNLGWLLSTTLSRLFLQLWPSTVFVLLMLIRTPEEQKLIEH